MPPQEEVIDEIGYEITGPGYTFLEFAMTERQVSASSSSLRSTASPVTSSSSTTRYGDTHDAEYTQTYAGGTLMSSTPVSSSNTAGPTGMILSWDPYRSSSIWVTYDPSSALDYNSIQAPATSPTSLTSYSPSTAYAPVSPTDVNATSADAASDGSSESGPAPASKTSTVLKGVLGTIGALAIILVLIFCVRRRRAKRQLRNDPEMSQIVNAATTRPAVTPAESIDVVPLPPPLARYSRIVDSASAPALPSRALSPRDRHSIVSSNWADGSEMDAFATDGSSIARTLSTHSNDSRATDATVTTAENPFDHPAYTTLLSTSRRTRSTPTFNTGTLITASSSSPVDPFSDGHAAGPSVLGSADSPISPVSPAVTMSRRSHADTLDDLFADMAGEDAGDLSRGATIIRHVDAGSAPKGRQGHPEPERIGGGEVHIPPTYMELYPRQGARLPR